MLVVGSVLSCCTCFVPPSAWFLIFLISFVWITAAASIVAPKWQKKRPILLIIIIVTGLVTITIITLRNGFQLSLANFNHQILLHYRSKLALRDMSTQHDYITVIKIYRRWGGGGEFTYISKSFPPPDFKELHYEERKWATFLFTIIYMRLGVRTLELVSTRYYQV